MQILNPEEGGSAQHVGLVGERDEPRADATSPGPPPPPREAKSYAELLLRCWKLIAVTLVLGLHGDIDRQVFTPYFYSRVACCGGLDGGPPLTDVISYAGHDLTLAITAETCDCELAATYGKGVAHNGSIAACDLPFISSDSRLWSHSARCPNFPYVQAVTQTLKTTWQTLQGLSALFFLPVFGRIADIYGRRQVFYWTTVMTIIAFAVFIADAYLLLGDWAVYLTAPMTAVFATHGLVSWAMAIDLVPDPIDQAKFFPILSPILNGSLASVLGDALGYFVLAAHIEDYTMLWLFLFIVAVIACVFIRSFVPETMANPRPFPGCSRELAEMLLPCVPKSSTVSESLMSDDSTDLGAENAPKGGDDYGFRIWFSGPDPRGEARPTPGHAARLRYMRTSIALSIVTAITGGASALDQNYLMGPLHFKQEELSILSLVSKLFILFGTVLAAVVIPRIGPYRCYVLSFVLWTTSRPLFISDLPYKAGPYLSALVDNVGSCILAPTDMMYMAAILQPSDLTRAQSSLAVIGKPLQIIAPGIFTALFYGSQERMDHGYLVSAFIFASTVVIVLMFIPRELPDRAAPRFRRAQPARSTENKGAAGDSNADVTGV